MLGPIVAVTMTVSDLKPVEDAYTKYLGYKVIERGQVAEDIAKMWGAPKAAGKTFITMAPESGYDCYLRFVVIDEYKDYKTLHTYGWNSTEILVTDADAVHERLKGSPFRVVGLPRGLSSNPDIKAMQVIGPAKEVLYFTNIKDPAMGLGQATTFIDRPFIVINGASSMDGLLKFYGETLGIKVGKPQPVRLSALNAVRGFDLERRHPLSTADIGGPFLIEIDQYPEGTVDREVRPGDLPPGTAIVTFTTPSIAKLPVPLVAGTAIGKGKPYNGRKAAVFKGISGELHEVIEAP